MPTAPKAQGRGATMGQAQQSRTVLIVEDDSDLRSLTAALLEDEQVDVIQCESAEAALATMLIGGREVGMIFADVRLRGVMDGIDLAWEVKIRWPRLCVVLTSGYPREHVGELPRGAGLLNLQQRLDSSVSGTLTRLNGS